MELKLTDKKIVPSGMKEGKHYIFRCSNCDAPLADLMVNYDLDVEWNIVVECCHCGDRSYEQTVKGNFLVGQSEESGKFTAIVDYDLSSDPIIMKTVKVADYVKEKVR